MNLEDIKKVINNREKNNKRNISNPKTILKRFGIIATTAALAMQLAACRLPKTKEEQENKTSISDSNNKDDEYTHLDSVEAILQDFKERYAEAYNEDKEMSHLTDRIDSADSIELLITKPTALFLTKDGQYVTVGKDSAKTEAIIKEIYGEDGCTMIFPKYAKLYQILLDGKQKDSLAVFSHNNKNIKTAVISSNNLEEKIKQDLAKGYGQGLSILKNFEGHMNCVLEANASYTTEKETENYIKQYKRIVEANDVLIGKTEKTIDNEGR